MEECKNSDILPCYRDGYGVWHYLDDTHEKVYKLNKQMCDLGKRLSDPFDPPSEETLQWACGVLEHNLKTMRELNRRSKLPMEITEEHIKIINRFMEEKKTKKMTRADAFEWLKCKKVRTCGEPRLLEKKLMECGYRWMRGVTWENDDYEDFWAYFMGYDGLITFVDIECSDYYECHDFEDISAEDILSIEIIDGEDDIAEKNVFLQARDIMKWLREKQSPHTLMIIDGNHVELLDGVKSEVWKE